MTPPPRGVDPWPHRSDEELATAMVESLTTEGRLGAGGVALVWRIMKKRRDHPAIAQSSEGDDAVLAMTSQFFADHSASFGQNLLVKAPRLSPGAVVGLTVKSVINWLNDEWRKTAFGSVEHRLSQLLSQEPQFQRVDKDHWYLTGLTPGVWDGDEQDLLIAARRVPATIPSWTSTSRRPPLAPKGDLLRVLEAVLTQAGGPVRTSVLTRVCLQRFPHADDPAQLPLDGRPERADDQRSVEDEALAAVDAPIAYSEALALISTLDDDELFMLHHWHDITSIGAYLRLGRSQAFERRAALGARLVEQVGLCADPEEVEAAFPAVLRAWTGKELPE